MARPVYRARLSGDPGDELLARLRELGVPEAETAQAIIALCRRLGFVNNGTGPGCNACGDRQLEVVGNFAPGTAWLRCSRCGHQQLQQLESVPGLQQLMQAEGIDEDQQPYFWETP